MSGRECHFGDAGWCDAHGVGDVVGEVVFTEPVFECFVSSVFDCGDVVESPLVVCVEFWDGDAADEDDDVAVDPHRDE